MVDQQLHWEVHQVLGDQEGIREAQIVVLGGQTEAREDQLVAPKDLTEAWGDLVADWEVLNQPSLHFHCRELLSLL